MGRGLYSPRKRRVVHASLKKRFLQTQTHINAPQLRRAMFSTPLFLSGILGGIFEWQGSEQKAVWQTPADNREM